MENHTWRVRRDRDESLIHDHSMVDPPTKDFQQSPLLLIAKAYEKVQTHAHKFIHICSTSIIVITLVHALSLNYIPKRDRHTYKHTAAYP